jgi:hypothetical protein
MLGILVIAAFLGVYLLLYFNARRKTALERQEAPLFEGMFAGVLPMGSLCIYTALPLFRVSFYKTEFAVRMIQSEYYAYTGISQVSHFYFLGFSVIGIICNGRSAVTILTFKGKRIIERLSIAAKGI